MIRLILGLALGVYFGFNYPKYIARCRVMCRQHMGELHRQFHEEGTE